jgi:hypothetical protein
MSRKLRFWYLPLIAAGMLAAAPSPAFAGGVVDPAPIGPNQLFQGLVNGQTANATIQMACFGPVHPGQTGHPLPGQTVKALPLPSSSTVDSGYTGSAANSIDVFFGPSSSVASPVVLRYWAVSAAIPTTLVLPCFDTGTVTFVPTPTSATARNATVQVTFVGQP